MSSDPVMDYIVNGGDELAKTKAELAYALGALEREMVEAQHLRDEVSRLSAETAEAAKTCNSYLARAEAAEARLKEAEGLLKRLQVLGGDDAINRFLAPPRSQEVTAND